MEFACYREEDNFFAAVLVFAQVDLKDKTYWFFVCSSY